MLPQAIEGVVVPRGSEGLVLDTPGATAGELMTTVLCSLPRVFQGQVSEQHLCESSRVWFFPRTHCHLNRATERGRQYSSLTVQGLKGISRDSFPGCHQPLLMVQAGKRGADSEKRGSVQEVFLVELRK